MGNRVLEGADGVNLAAALLRQGRLRGAARAGEAAWVLVEETRGNRERLLCSAVLIEALGALGEVEAARNYRAELSEADTWGETIRQRQRLTEAALTLAEARAAGRPADDPALAAIRALVDELRAQPSMYFLLYLSRSHG